jgi:hypothetical protein
MNERILNLYNLFLQAKEKGHKVLFRHGNDIYICLLDESEKVKDVTGIVFDAQMMDFYFRSAEQFLNKLIGSDVK